MACPTCGHSMAAFEGTPTSQSWLCDRCGTVKRLYKSHSQEDIYVPKLVERCRILEEQFVKVDEYPPLTLAWRTWLGIAESIRPPEERGQ